MENSIFRKSALERISSPEQLSEHMKVAGPGVWCILAGLAATFAAFFIWGITGTIPETAEISGTAIIRADVPIAVYCFLSIDETQPLSVGMNVRVSPSFAPREQYGYMYGTIKSIGSSPVTAERLEERLGDDIQYLSLPSGNLIEVVVELDARDDGSPVWSTSRGNSLSLTPGTSCELTVITNELKPYELMFR